jgi:tRNA modification GTPase
MDTIFAPITPVVSSAVIVVRISGKDTVKAFKLFKKKDGSIPAFEHARVYHLNFIHNNKELDDVIAYYFKSPKSYTGEDILEISFHGNPKIISMAFNEFIKLGFRFAEPGEFTKRAFLNGKLDLSQAEAVNELISAKSEYAVMRSFEQLKGNLKADILEFKDKLIDVLSVVEVFVDFPDEDIDDELIVFCRNQLKSVIDKLSYMIDTFNKMKYFKYGVTVAIAGRPNVGKSSLLNTLLNEDRAIVSDIPGTTRDFIEETIMIKDLPVRFVDTAGLRDTNSDIESAGIGFSYKRIKEADIVLLVFDASNPLSTEDINLLDDVKGENVIKVANKCDKPICVKMDYDVLISAKSKINIDKLTDLIYERAVGADFDKSNQTFLITERHYNAFLDVYNILSTLYSNFDTDKLDLISIDLQDCLEKITEITGQKYTNELLDNIFSKFCIGK